LTVETPLLFYGPKPHYAIIIVGVAALTAVIGAVRTKIAAMVEYYDSPDSEAC
jgi:hypothetical protein